VEQTTIERVDSILLLIAWMEQMQIGSTIDQHWQPHRGWTVTDAAVPE
jgi:hypothetical protein